MKIGILSQIKQRRITGINRVTVGTLAELLKIDREDDFFWIGRTDWLPIQLPMVDTLFSSVDRMDIRLPVSIYKVDLVHSHSRAFNAEAGAKCAKVLTIHDMIPFLFPEWMNQQRDYFDGPLRRTAETADVVIADSQSTKRDVLNHYNVPEEKVRVIYNGLFTSDFSNPEKYGRPVESLVNVPYILTVSAVGMNKNQIGLIEAYLHFREHYKDIDIPLVIAGPMRQYQVIREMLERYPDGAKDVFFMGFVEDGELLWLYKNALAFAYVSFYEGFGLPILEAMSAGRAVISSNTSSMPEVGGDACEYCDPYDVDSIEAALINVVMNKEHREMLEKRALMQVGKFSYQRTARETLEVYRMFA